MLQFPFACLWSVVRLNLLGSPKRTLLKLNLKRIRPLRFPSEKCQKCQRADFRSNKSECKANGYCD